MRWSSMPMPVFALQTPLPSSVSSTLTCVSPVARLTMAPLPLAIFLAACFTTGLMTGLTTFLAAGLATFLSAISPSFILCQRFYQSIGMLRFAHTYTQHVIEPGCCKVSHKNTPFVQPSFYLPCIAFDHRAEDKIGLRRQGAEQALLLQFIREPLSLGDDCLYLFLKIGFVSQGFPHR